MTDTRVAQPAVYVASILQATESIESAQAAACFGHSMGELGAMAFAGLYSAADGVELAIWRAERAHEADRHRPGAMAVVMRLESNQIEMVRRRALFEAGGAIEVAVLNGPGQVVLSGDAVTIDHALDIVEGMNGTARKLPIGGAYHSPLLYGCIETFAGRISRLALREPRVPVISSTTTQPVRTPEEVVAALSQALVLPVRWPETLAAVRALGISRAVDAGPGSTLANLSRFTPELELWPLSPQRARSGA